MKFRVLMHLEIEAKDEQQALDHAKKLGELLKNPLARMQIEGEGICLVNGDGRPLVYHPQRV